MITITLPESFTQQFLELLIKQNNPIQIVSENSETSKAKLQIETGCPEEALNAPLPPLPADCTKWIARGRFKGIELGDIPSMPNIYFWQPLSKSWIWTSSFSHENYHIQAV
jgi:hypothetical protein